jgi:hypothetical protein
MINGSPTKLPHAHRTTRLPWWASVVFAGVFYVAMKWLAPQSGNRALFLTPSRVLSGLAGWFAIVFFTNSILALQSSPSSLAGRSASRHRQRLRPTLEGVEHSSGRLIAARGMTSLNVVAVARMAASTSSAEQGQEARRPVQALARAYSRPSVRCAKMVAWPSRTVREARRRPFLRRGPRSPPRVPPSLLDSFSPPTTPGGTTV